MGCAAADETVEIRAYSPGGELRTLYYETGYDLGRAKGVEEDWLRENAIGRHSFVEVDPPRKVQASDLGDYVGRELLEGN